MLIVDDELARIALSRMLQREGATTESFADGVSAVAWCAMHHGAVVDALILDLRMPVMGGVETRLALLQALSPQRPASIGISAALQDSQGTEERRDAAAAGFDAFLPKPVDWPDMRQALERLLAAADARRDDTALRAAQMQTTHRRGVSELLSQGLQALAANDIAATDDLALANVGAPGSEGGTVPSRHAAEAAILRMVQRARARGTPLAKSPDGACRLVYRSHGRLSEAQSMALLVQCQANNVRNGVTGMLIHDGERFIQVLEGSPATIDSLFNRIRHDPRHSGVDVLEVSIDQPRLFGAWSMGSVSLDPRHFELLLGHLKQRAEQPVHAT